MVEAFDPVKRKEGLEGLSRKVLYAEDDPSLSAAMLVFLEMEDLEVVHVTTGDELINKLMSGEKFGIVLTDNNMSGGISGLEAIRKIRTNPEFDKLPIIMFAGLEAEERIAAVKELEGLNAEFIGKSSMEDFYHAIETVKNKLEIPK